MKNTVQTLTISNLKSGQSLDYYQDILDKKYPELNTKLKKYASFNNEEDISEFFSETFSGAPIAARLNLMVSDFENSDKFQELQNKKDELSNSVSNFFSSLFDRFKEQKSSKKGCDECGSSISRPYLIKNIEASLIAENDEIREINFDDLSCPICGNKNFIANDSDLQKLKKIKEKVSSFDDKISEERIKYDLKNGSEITSIFIVVPVSKEETPNDPESANNEGNASHSSSGEEKTSMDNVENDQLIDSKSTSSEESF